MSFRVTQLGGSRICRNRASSAGKGGSSDKREEKEAQVIIYSISSQPSASSWLSATCLTAIASISNCPLISSFALIDFARTSPTTCTSGSIPWSYTCSKPASMLPSQSAAALHCPHSRKSRGPESEGKILLPCTL